MAIGHFILSLSCHFFTIIFSVIWSGGHKGFRSRRGPGAREGEGGSKGLYGMERDTHDEVFAFYPINFFFVCLFVCLFGITIYF